LAALGVLFGRCLVELDRVAVGIIDEDLSSSRADLDLVPEVRARCP
jgi:hypothetical protein